MKTKVKLIMVGTCPRCGKQLQRPLACTAAVCGCSNPHPQIIPLTPALLLPSRMYAKFSRISELSGVPLEQLINALLEEGTKKKLKELQSLPEIVVTTKER